MAYAKIEKSLRVIQIPAEIDPNVEKLRHDENADQGQKKGGKIAFFFDSFFAGPSKCEDGGEQQREGIGSAIGRQGKVTDFK
jgi:hypothetical protein